MPFLCGWSFLWWPSQFFINDFLFIYYFFWLGKESVFWKNIPWPLWKNRQQYWKCVDTFISKFQNVWLIFAHRPDIHDLYYLTYLADSKYLCDRRKCELRFLSVQCFCNPRKLLWWFFFFFGHTLRRNCLASSCLA